MRILYVNVEGKIAGGEKSLLLSLDVLKRKCEAIFTCPSGELARAVISRGIVWSRLPSAPRSRWFCPIGLIYILRLSLLLLWFLVKLKPDIVHANNIVGAFASWLPCFMTSTKLVLHVRDVPTRRWIYRFVGCRVACVIAVSEFIRSSLITIGVPDEKISVIYNPVEDTTAELSKLTSKAEEKKDYVFANIGQLVPWKNQLLFIEAAKIVAQRQPDTYFWIVGDDIFERNSRYRNFIMEKIESSPLENRIIFKGWQSDMDSIWRQLNCLVHTANNEPFGRVVVEAMQLGVPVITSNTGGPAEILDDGVTGCLVAKDEAENFATAMLKMYFDREKAIEMASNAKRHVSEKFSQAAISDEIFSVYRRVLRK